MRNFGFRHKQVLKYFFPPLTWRNVKLEELDKSYRMRKLEPSVIYFWVAQLLNLIG